MNLTLDVDYFADDLSILFDLYQLVIQQIDKAKLDVNQLKRGNDIEVEEELSVGIQCSEHLEKYMIQYVYKQKKLNEMIKKFQTNEKIIKKLKDAGYIDNIVKPKLEGETEPVLAEVDLDHSLSYLQSNQKEFNTRHTE